MLDVAHPEARGQDVDSSLPSDEPEGRRRRCDALKLSDEEARHVRTAIRKLIRAHGTVIRLAIMLEMPAGAVRRFVNPKGTRPTGTFAIRLAALAKVPVEVLLGGKMVVAPVLVGRAA